MMSGMMSGITSGMTRGMTHGIAIPRQPNGANLNSPCAAQLSRTPEQQHLLGVAQVHMCTHAASGGRAVRIPLLPPGFGSRSSH